MKTECQSPPRFFVSIPHSGEKVPSFCTWLQHLPEPVLMRDVDRFVDQLYTPYLQKMKIPTVLTQWHRYAADLNRLPQDIDAGTVQGSPLPAGNFSRGFHWSITTLNETLMNQPVTQEIHQQLVQLIYDPFHQEIRQQYQKFFLLNSKPVYHLDLHSMPSMGTKEHRDPGQKRADVVISDSHGKTCSEQFRKLVIQSYEQAGFHVAYNWPYYGGRVTEQYGHPDKNQHVMQVELNRCLYMNEETKQARKDLWPSLQMKLDQALQSIYEGIHELD